MDNMTLKRLLDVAQGSAPADVVIRNGKLVNVFTDNIDIVTGIIVKMIRNKRLWARRATLVGLCQIFISPCRCNGKKGDNLCWRRGLR